jgi:tRNA nucleotidyltransferase (CCA-adding enzyme)
MDVIVSHVNADFDSLAGLVGAARLYPGAALVLPGSRSGVVRNFLSLHREVIDPKTFGDINPETITRVVVVDVCNRKRLGAAAAWLDLPDVDVHLYDHHPGAGCDVEASLRHVEPFGAVATVLARLLRDRGETPTSFEATVLLLGIYEDTGSLQFGGTSPADLEAAAWLLECGGDLDVVAHFTRRSLTPDQRRLLREVLEHVEVRQVRGVPIALAPAPPGGYVEDAALLVHRILELEDVQAAFLMAEMDEVLYVIARSRSDAVDVGNLLRDLGGGGHPRAGSATLKGRRMPEVRDAIVAALEREVAPEPVAREIMSYPVRTVSPDDSVAEARRRMIRYSHSGLVVVQEGELVGVLTRRDVDKARHHRLEHAPVRGFMTREVATVTPTTPVSELERRMIEQEIGRLPVMAGGEVVGVVTRTDVLRALHGHRYLSGSQREGEEPALRLLRERLPAPLQRLLERVGQVADRERARAYAVGGFVRDLLLGEPNADVDVLVEPDALTLAQAMARDAGAAVKLDVRFNTAKLSLQDGLQVDFATARAESYERPGALPEVEPSSILDDLRRRDFTIDAMAVALNPECFGELLDPFGGRGHLERRVLRVLHNLSFREDPTRILRGVAFEARFHFRMDAHTERRAREAIADGAFDTITPERLRRELLRLVRNPRPFGALLRLEELGFLRWLHPRLELDAALLKEIPSALDWWRDRAGERLDRSAVFLAAVLAPLGAAEAARAAGERLRCRPTGCRALEEGLRAMREVESRVPLESSPAELTSRLRDLAPESLVLLRAAADRDRRARLDQYLARWRGIRLEITGDDLKALGHRPGPALGEALRATLDARLNGEIAAREEQLAYARRYLEGDLPRYNGGAPVDAADEA